MSDTSLSGVGGGPKLAYYVQCGQDAAAIVFATSYVAARRLGADELDIEFGEVTSCYRKPELDQYASKGEVEPEILIEQHGFGFECHECYGNVDTYNETRCYNEFGEPFCCPECREKY